jgi:hypothetical protein
VLRRVERARGGGLLDLHSLTDGETQFRDADQNDREHGGDDGELDRRGAGVVQLSKAAKRRPLTVSHAYSTNLLGVAPIAVTPVPEQVLLNDAPPLKLMRHATSCVQLDAVLAPLAKKTSWLGK